MLKAAVGGNGKRSADLEIITPLCTILNSKWKGEGMTIELYDL